MKTTFVVLLFVLLVLTSCDGLGLPDSNPPQIDQPPSENFSGSSDEPSGTPVRSVVVFIHGVNSGPDNYDGWINNAAGLFPGGTWPDDILIVRVDWGHIDGVEGSTIVGNRAYAGTFDGYVNGMGPRPWDAVAKLKNIVGKIRYAFGFQIPITIVSHSQGTVITLTALQEGMGIDNWVLMGSSLSQEKVANGENNTNFGFATANVFGKIVNYFSEEDYIGLIGPVEIYWHIGRLGITSVYDLQKNNFYQDQIAGVTHSGSNGWWKGLWIQNVLNQGQQTFLMDLISGSSPYYLNKSQMDFFHNEVQNYARGGNPNWWGDSDHNWAEETFYLPGGMSNGFFFDDKDEADYIVSCYEGRAEVQMLEAQYYSFDDGTNPEIVNAGYELKGTYVVNSYVNDATVWLSVRGLDSNIVTRCYVGFEAWDQ